MPTPSANYTVSGEDFSIPTDETEQTDPTQYIIKPLKALDNHTHASTRGGPVARLAASVALSGGGTSLTGAGLTIATGGLAVTAGGITVTAGGLLVTAGNVGIGSVPVSQVGLGITETINAAGGAAVGISLQPTLVADVNGAFLYGLLVQGGSVFNPNGHTTVSAYGINIGAVTGANANNYGLVIAAPSGAGTDNVSLVAQGAVRFSALAARVAGDVYVIMDANGNLHKSAIGPAS